MISVVMPYWNRADALEATLASYARHYTDGPTLQIIIVDDGSEQPVRVPERLPWQVLVVILPAKSGALNPCVPFNIGVRVADGDKILLTNPEVAHEAPIIAEMAAACSPLAYVAAACRDDEKWLCHSSNKPGGMGRAKMPEGAGFHFCAMLHKALYYAVDGFSEEYRQGQAYEDNDFLWKLHAAGAQFIIRDDLLTRHQTAPRCKWPQGGAARNKAIFEKKWGA